MFILTKDPIDKLIEQVIGIVSNLEKFGHLLPASMNRSILSSKNRELSPRKVLEKSRKCQMMKLDSLLMSTALTFKAGEP